MAHTSQYRKRKAALLSVGYHRLRPYDFDFSLLENIHTIKRVGNGSHDLFNDVVIMIDTETSKARKNKICDNHICAWTISILAYHVPICTLYGTRPDEMVDSMDQIHQAMRGERTLAFCHNLSYDYVFLRQFFYAKWGTPTNQLNTKPYYPLFVNFENGLQLRDSLILAQRSLDKWGKDLQVEHAKAVGFWNYDKIRNQSDDLTDENELTYIEHDTLCGVECIDKTIQALNKKIYSLPYTATGINREEVQKRGKAHHAHEKFQKIQTPDYDIQKIQEDFVYHGGYTHANRHCIGFKLDTTGKDFVSSYIYQLLVMKAPTAAWQLFEKDITLEEILKLSDRYAFMFQMKMVKPRLKDDHIPMPVLQFSKCMNKVNAVLDNGRILCASYLDFMTNEIDVQTILEQYVCEGDPVICNVYYAPKDYLPRWFTDYVYELFKEKCKHKGGDAVLYSLAKARVNSMYGLTVQRPVKLQIDEDYATGDYHMKDPETDPTCDPRKLYEKYFNNRNSVLPYVWGIYVTSCAQRSLFELGKCVGEGNTWVYSDTDSIYATGWDEELVSRYNENCKKKLIERGYPGVEEKGKVYWLGIAEPDPEMVYKEFVTQGAKRYAGRCQADGKLHITVAGVPKKKGAECLKDDMDNFRPGFVFDGETTGKLQHTYFFHPEGIWTDENGNLVGDSVDLSPADYTLSDVWRPDWERIFEEEIELQVYEDDFNFRRA